MEVLIVSSKFDDIPNDPDTNILLSQEALLGKYDILYQMWTWKGITAHSFIFTNDDVKGLTEEDIIKLAKSSPFLKYDTKITFSKLDSGYTFVNFNFVAKE